MSEEQERAECLKNAHYGSDNPKRLGQMCAPCAEYNLRVLRARLTEALALIAVKDEALEESVALNKNWVADAEPETLAYYSEYRVVIKRGEAALAAKMKSEVM